jgi:cellobiose phosphorylase
VKAILHGLRFGSHGFPLIGTCDWNDGMNRVGDQGKGESVWLAFFLYDVLIQFAKVAVIYKDPAFAEHCRKEAFNLQKNIEQHGWSGEWYLRAYFDDGTPLGSPTNEECQIDSLTQSWSILSEAGDPERSRKGMESVNARLVRRDKALVQLLDPPFDKSSLNPGYIKGYVPGVRENGGQYTHAAIWVAMAFAKMKDSKNAWEVLSLLNPINHARTPEAVMKYKVEPYVLAADVYAFEPHVGRGGWSWYTGSAGWMYRLMIESLLGLRLEGEDLFIEPCFPEEWSAYTIHYRFRQTVYHLHIQKVTQAGEKSGTTVDGNYNPVNVIHMTDDGREHWVEVNVGEGNTE